MAIFLLRGLVREKAHWGTFPSELDNSLKDVKIITPEIQGVGEYYQSVTPDNFEDMVHFMREKFYLPVKDEGPHYIMAMSLGGMIARCWMELYPNDFEGAILVNTSFKGINSLFNRLRPKAVLNFLKIFANPSIEKRERMIVGLVSNNEANYEKVATEWIEIQKKRPVMRKSFLSQMKAALTYNPPKDRPKAKLLWLTSKSDRLCSYKSTVGLQKLWGGDIHIHETAGHDFPLDDSKWLISKIKTWLQKAS